MSEKKTALVTGGAGFIGSHIVDALLKRGFSVKVLDNLSTGKLKNISHLEGKIEFEQADIRDLETVKNISSGCDLIFHQAAIVSVPKTVEKPVMSSIVNDLGTLYILEAARKKGVKRVILASSSAVYGDNPELPKRENMALKLQSPYALQKYNNELSAKLYNEIYGLETICLRYFNVFGPRQDPESPYSGVISIFMDRAIKKKQPVIFGDGEQYRDFVYVEDVVRANILAATETNASGQVINIGTGNYVSINDLWYKIAAMCGIEINPEYFEPRDGDIRESVADTYKAKSILGYEVKWHFDDGLRLTYDWYRDSQKNADEGV